MLCVVTPVSIYPEAQTLLLFAWAFLCDDHYTVVLIS